MSTIYIFVKKLNYLKKAKTFLLANFFVKIPVKIFKNNCKIFIFKHLLPILKIYKKKMAIVYKLLPQIFAPFCVKKQRQTCFDQNQLNVNDRLAIKLLRDANPNVQCCDDACIAMQ